MSVSFLVGEFCIQIYDSVHEWKKKQTPRYSSILFGELCQRHFLFLFLPILAFVSPAMIRKLCLGMCQTREDNSLMALIELERGYGCTEVSIKWCTHNAAFISLWAITFSARRVKSIPKTLITPLTEFFSFMQMLRKLSIQPTLVSYCFYNSSLCQHLCSSVHMRILLCSAAVTVSSTWSFIVFNVLKIISLYWLWAL